MSTLSNLVKHIPDIEPWVSKVDQPHFEECDLEEAAGTFLKVQLETSEAFDEALHHHGVEQSRINRSWNL